MRLYADAANAKTKLENGFDLTNYDERTLAFAKDYSNQLLAIDVNLDTTEMLDVAWSLFGKYFRPEEVNIKKELVDQLAESKLNKCTIRRLRFTIDITEIVNL